MSLTRETVERLADRILERNGVASPPVDVDLISEREGLAFEYADFRAASGAYYSEGPGRGRAIISSGEHPLRQVFSKAHELGHHMIERPENARMAGIEYVQLPAAYRGRDRHWAHEFFAACLLMPRRWIGMYMRDRGWQLERPQLVDDVARRFGVSRRAAEVRLCELGHIEEAWR